MTRRLLLAGTAVAMLAPVRPGRAEIKSLEIIAPAGPGGGYDQLARATQEVLQAKQLASGVQVQNIPGAGGTIGLAQFVTKGSRSPSLLVAGLGPHRRDRDQQVAGDAGSGGAHGPANRRVQPLVVAADSPIKSVGDLLAQFKADPGSVSWGGFALGSPDHILCALIVKAGGGDVAKMNYIVAGAGGEMLAQVMGGHLTVATGGLNEMAQQIQTGKLRAIGISSPERLPGVDIPTFKEQGVDATLVNWRGLMAPAKMRRADKEALDKALGEMVKQRPVAGAAEGTRLGRHVPVGGGIRVLPRTGADPDRRNSAGSRADPVDGEDARNDQRRGLRIGEAVLGGVVFGLGLFIAIETSMLEVAPVQCRHRPAPVPVPDCLRPAPGGGCRALAGRPSATSRTSVVSSWIGGRWPWSRPGCCCRCSWSSAWAGSSRPRSCSSRRRLPLRNAASSSTVLIGLVLTGLTFVIFNYGLGLTLPIGTSIEDLLPATDEDAE